MLYAVLGQEPVIAVGLRGPGPLPGAMRALLVARPACQAGPQGHAGKAGEWPCAYAAQAVPRRCMPTVLAKERLKFLSSDASMGVSLIIGRRQHCLKSSLILRYRGKMARLSMV